MWQNTDKLVSNYTVTNPIPIVRIPSAYPPVDIGPGIGPIDPNGGPYIDTIIPARYEPNPDKIRKIYDSLGNPHPSVPILYRNYYETFNTGNGKTTGGNDQYNIYDIPSYNQLYGGNYKLVRNDPFYYTLVDSPYDTPVQYESHGGPNYR